MNLAEYLPVQEEEDWRPDDDIALEQCIAALEALEAKEAEIATLLTRYPDVLDISQHYPGSPAFEGLGGHARSLLSVSLEHQGKGWLLKTWDAIREAASRMFDLIMRLFSMIFQAYRDMAMKARDTKRELEEMNQSTRVVLTINNPMAIQFKGEVTLASLKAGVKGNVANNAFFTGKFIQHVRSYYQDLASQIGDFSRAFTTKVDKDKVVQMHQRFRSDLLKERFLKDSQQPQSPMLGDYGIVIPTDTPEGYVTLRRAYVRMGSKSVRMRVERPGDIAKILGDVVDVCMAARTADVRSRELTRLRDNTMRDYDRVIRRSDWGPAGSRQTVSYFLRVLNANMLSALRQYHAFNFRSCRALIGIGRDIIRQSKAE